MVSTAHSVRIFVDTAEAKLAREYLTADWVKGITTNTSIAAKAGVRDYRRLLDEFAALTSGGDVSVAAPALGSVDALSRDARNIARIQQKLFVKIPHRLPDGTYMGGRVVELAKEGVRVNITAITSHLQIEQVDLERLNDVGPFFVSVFAGRLSDHGIDPRKIVDAFRALNLSNMKLLWASTRDLLAVQHAEETGCDAVTLSPALLQRYLRPENPLELSLSAIRGFNADALENRYSV